MITNGTNKVGLAGKVKQILAKEPGLSVKELAERLKTNRQFMAGVLKVLEERGEVSFRQVGPAAFTTLPMLQKENTLVHNNGPFGTVPEPLFEKKQFIPVLQQLQVSRSNDEVLNLVFYNDWKACQNCLLGSS